MVDTTQYIYGVTVPIEAAGYLITRRSPFRDALAYAIASCRTQMVAEQIAAALALAQPTVEEIEAAGSRPLVATWPPIASEAASPAADPGTLDPSGLTPAIRPGPKPWHA